MIDHGPQSLDRAYRGVRQTSDDSYKALIDAVLVGGVDLIVDHHTNLIISEGGVRASEPLEVRHAISLFGELDARGAHHVALHCKGGVLELIRKRKRLIAARVAELRKREAQPGERVVAWKPKMREASK